MANTQVRVRSPKGNVGVTDVVDAGELSAYSMGALSGFDATSAASWTLQIGGSSTVQDVAIGRNPAGESELFVGTSATTVPFIIGGAPGTPGQSRTDALVLYKDPFTTTVVNNGLDITDYAVVAGTPATTGTQVPPSMATIRSTIPTGSLKFVAVIGYVTIANGAGSVTTGNYFKNPALLHTQTVANATDRGLITPVEGMEVYQLDTDMKQIYDGSSWCNIPRLLKKVTLTAAGDTISATGIPLRDDLRVRVYCKNSGVISCAIRFNNDATTKYALSYTISGAAYASLFSQTSMSISPATEAYPFFSEIEISNTDSAFKTAVIHSTDMFGTDATTGTNWMDARGKYAPAANTQISRIDVINFGAGDLAIGSYIEIWG